MGEVSVPLHLEPDLRVHALLAAGLVAQLRQDEGHAGASIRGRSFKTGAGLALAASLRRAPVPPTQAERPDRLVGERLRVGPREEAAVGRHLRLCFASASGEGRPTLDGWLVLRGDRGVLVGEARLRRRGEADDRDDRGDENEWLLHDSPLVTARNLVSDEARLGAG